MELPDELLFQDWRPGRRRERRLVSRLQVLELYGLADEAGSVTFTWNNCEDPVVIVGIGLDWLVASLMIDQTWCG